jgi:transposase
MSKPRRRFNREFKEAVVRRMLAGANVSALGRELGIRGPALHGWRRRFQSGGPEALRDPGRPRRTARVDAAATELGASLQRIAELERKIGQQQVELDFFRQALRQVEAARRPSNGPGVTGSTPSSKR